MENLGNKWYASRTVITGTLLMVLAVQQVGDAGNSVDGPCSAASRRCRELCWWFMHCYYYISYYILVILVINSIIFYYYITIITFCTVVFCQFSLYHLQPTLTYYFLIGIIISHNFKIDWCINNNPADWKKIIISFSPSIVITYIVMLFGCVLSSIVS